MIIRTVWYIFLSGVALFGSDGSKNLSEPSIRYSVTPSTIVPGEHAILEITLEGTTTANDNNDSAVPVVNDKLLYDSKQVVLLEQNVSSDNGTYTYRYEVTGYRPGIRTLPPIEIRYGSQQFSTAALLLVVDNQRERDDLELRTHFEKMPLPLMWRSTLRKTLYVVAVLGVLIGLFALLRKLSRLNVKRARVAKNTQPATTLPGEDPDEWLRKQLAELRKSIGHDEVGLIIFDRLFHVLKEYFERKSSKPVQCWTSKEILKNLNTAYPVEALSKVFEFCDNARFSGKAISPIKELANGVLLESERVLVPCCN